MSRQILKYPGAKCRVADWIVGFIPENKVYLEPFFGSGAVFFRKKESRIETINDIDDDVVNFFKVVRNNPGELERLLSNTPWSRVEYDNAYTNAQKNSCEERARKFAVKCFMGFGCGNRYRNGFRSSHTNNSPSTAKVWEQVPELCEIYTGRLRHAQIEHTDALKLITSYNNEDVLIYADPPYMPGTRKPYLYNNEMTADEHRRLLEVLLAHRGGGTSIFLRE
jgi:DNA adenine methylase